jgi:hypothetical protein
MTDKQFPVSSDEFENSKKYGLMITDSRFVDGCAKTADLQSGFAKTAHELLSKQKNADRPILFRMVLFRTGSYQLSVVST